MALPLFYEKLKHSTNDENIETRKLETVRLTFPVSDGLVSLPVSVQGEVRVGLDGGGGGDHQ